MIRFCVTKKIIFKIKAIVLTDGFQKKRALFLALGLGWQLLGTDSNRTHSCGESSALPLQ